MAHTISSNLCCCECNGRKCNISINTFNLLGMVVHPAVKTTKIPQSILWKTNWHCSSVIEEVHILSWNVQQQYNCGFCSKELIYKQRKQKNVACSLITIDPIIRRKLLNIRLCRMLQFQ